MSQQFWEQRKRLYSSINNNAYVYMHNSALFFYHKKGRRKKQEIHVSNNSIVSHIRVKWISSSSSSPYTAVTLALEATGLPMGAPWIRSCHDSGEGSKYMCVYTPKLSATEYTLSQCIIGTLKDVNEGDGHQASNLVYTLSPILHVHHKASALRCILQCIDIHTSISFQSSRVQPESY